MKSCLINPHPGSGLLSLFNNVVACLERYEKVDVQWTTKKTLYTAVKASNLWDIIAEPLDKVTEPFEVKDRAITTYTGVNAAWWYLRDDGWRERLHLAYQRVRFHSAVSDIIGKELNGNWLRLGDCVAIQHRSSKSIGFEQLTAKPVPPSYMIRAANRLIGSGCVFVACDSIQALEEFRQAFGPRMLTFESLNRSSIGGEPHFEEPQNEDHVRMIMAQTIALSICRHLIHGVSNIATAALYMNPAMSNTFVQG